MIGQFLWMLYLLREYYTILNNKIEALIYHILLFCVNHYIVSLFKTS